MGWTTEDRSSSSGRGKRFFYGVRTGSGPHSASSPLGTGAEVKGAGRAVRLEPKCNSIVRITTFLFLSYKFTDLNMYCGIFVQSKNCGASEETAIAW
jgi:hypothetical protein